MTLHQAIPTQDIDDAANWRAVVGHLGAACDAASHMKDGQRALGEALCGALETVGGGAPAYEPFGDLRSSAAWWADVATPLELEAYASAALQRITRATFAGRARKRMFNDLWRSFTPQERAAFLAEAQKRERPP
jgi:hypothetical protein